MIDDDFEAWLTSAPIASRFSEERIEVILHAIYTGSHLMAEGLVHEGLEKAYRAQLEHQRMCNR